MPIVKDTPPKHPENALAETFALLLAMGGVGIGGVFLRWPAMESSLVMGTLMSTFVCFGIPDFFERANRIFTISLCGGTFLFLLGVLSKNSILMLITIFLGCFCFLRIFSKKPAVAIVILIIGVYSTKSTGGWLNSLDRAIFLQYTEMFALFAIEIARRIFRTAPEPLPEPGYETGVWDAFALAVCVTCGFYLYTATRMPQGYWMSFTVLLAHTGGTFGDQAAVRASTRLFMAPLGMWCAFLFLGILCWFDYVFAYTFPVWVGLGYYLYLRFGLFRWRTFLQMLFFVLLYDSLYGEYRQLDILNLLTARSAAILIGGVFAILSEPVRRSPLPDVVKVS